MNNQEHSAYMKSLMFMRTEYSLKINDDKIIKLLDMFSVADISSAFKIFNKLVDKHEKSNHYEKIVSLIISRKSNVSSIENDIFDLLEYSKTKFVDLNISQIRYLIKEFNYYTVRHAIEETYDLRKTNNFKSSDFDMITKHMHNKKSIENTKTMIKKDFLFNSFEQRQYDYDDLERKLLGWE